MFFKLRKPINKRIVSKEKKNQNCICFRVNQDKHFYIAFIRLKRYVVITFLLALNS